MFLAKKRRGKIENEKFLFLLFLIGSITFIEIISKYFRVLKRKYQHRNNSVKQISLHWLKCFQRGDYFFTILNKVSLLNISFFQGFNWYKSILERIWKLAHFSGNYTLIDIISIIVDYLFIYLFIKKTNLERIYLYFFSFSCHLSKIVCTILIMNYQLYSVLYGFLFILFILCKRKIYKWFVLLKYVINHIGHFSPSENSAGFRPDNSKKITRFLITLLFTKAGKLKLNMAEP